MFKAIGPFIVGVLWLIVATVLMGFLPTRLPFPDVALIVVIILSFHYPLTYGGCLSFSLGLVQDLLSGGAIGLNALSKTAVFSFSRLIARRFYLSTMISKILMVFLGGLVDVLVVIIILYLGKMIHTPFAVIAPKLLLQILWTGFLSPLVLVITPKISDLGDRGANGAFRYGHTKARVIGI